MKNKFIFLCLVANNICLLLNITTIFTVGVIRNQWNKDSVIPQNQIEVLEAKAKRKPPKRRIITSLPD
jgi:hypothetical protein